MHTVMEYVNMFKLLVVISIKSCVGRFEFFINAFAVNYM